MRGFNWVSKYHVISPNGQVFDTTRWSRPHIPKPQRWQCCDCDYIGYWDASKGPSSKPFRCKHCNAINGSKAHAIAKRLRHSAKLAEPRQCALEGCDVWFDISTRHKEKPNKYCSPTCARKDPANHRQPNPDDIPVKEYVSYWPYIPTNCRACGAFTLKARPSPGGAHHCSESCREHTKRLTELFQEKYQNKRRAAHHNVEYQPGISLGAVLERDNYTCQECGVLLQSHHRCWRPEAWTMGHIIPMAKGGPHIWGNVQAECLACNTWKGEDMSHVDWDALA